MKNVAYITDPFYLKHITGEHHPESPERLQAIEDQVSLIVAPLQRPKPKKVEDDMLLLVHSKEEITSVKKASENEKAIDNDTVCCKDSYDAACLAVGAGITALDGIKEGKFERAFCAIRPPGHHARPTQAMGFCLFNNIAIAAKYAQKIGFRKVMIIDFDVHHGNGTQETFYDDKTVFYFSSHQSFSYPGTGLENEMGEGEGWGYTANFLMMPDGGDDEVLHIYKNELPPLVDAFSPDIILVSAGYDLHESDPLAQLNVTTDGIRKVVRSILDSKDVPFIFFLEGGYDPKALGKNIKVTIEEMLKER